MFKNIQSYPKITTVNKDISLSLHKSIKFIIYYISIIYKNNYNVSREKKK